MIWVMTAVANVLPDHIISASVARVWRYKNLIITIIITITALVTEYSLQQIFR